MDSLPTLLISMQEKSSKICLIVGIPLIKTYTLQLAFLHMSAAPYLQCVFVINDYRGADATKIIIA